jgi:hypothetical protein
MKVSLPNDFTPRDYQSRYMRYFDAGGKKALWVVHRRGGKDLTAMHQTVKLAHQRKGVYWHIYPSFTQARKAIWEGFRRDGKRIMENVFPGFSDIKRAGSIIKKKDESQMMLELKCGSIWRLLGSDKIEVVGAGPVGVVYSEYAISNPRARNLIRPMLRENGGWESYITTPRGRNHAKELYDAAVKDPMWFCEVQRLRDTGAYAEWQNAKGEYYKSADEVMDEEKSDGMPDALVAQEYDCDWNAALVGAIWGDLINRLIEVDGMPEFDHDFSDVFTSWDLGITDSTAIWFWQFRDGGVDIIDYYEETGKPLSHYFDLIDSKPYKYVKHWLPHDARQVTLSSGQSILNQMLRKWPGQVVVGPNMPLLDGIQAGRWLLQQPIRFHPRVNEGLEALRQYHYDYDEEAKTFSSQPEHDWASHAADSFRYLACVVRVSEIFQDKIKKNRTPKVVEPIAKPLHHSFHLEQLFEDHSRRMQQRRRI